MSTFTDFKKDFYSRVTDFTLFDCGDINLLKVVLDGLRVDYVSKGKVRAYLFYSGFLYTLLLRIKNSRLSNKKLHDKFEQSLKQHQNKKYIVTDIGRIITTNKKSISIYFHKIIETLKREECVVVMDKVVDGTEDFDFNLKQVAPLINYLPLTAKQKKVRINIIKSFNRIKNSSVFSKNELQNIKFALHKFFHEYKVWDDILEYLPNICECFFICHYHKEGQIYALKERNIKCTELQHGLIAPQDIFYVFPDKIKSIKDKALFADRILVYGEYWKDILLQGVEYTKEQISVVGYYLYNDFSNFDDKKKYLLDITSQKQVILITTQTNLHKEFIKFTQDLEKHIKDEKINAIIILKPHPAEKKEIYLKYFQESEVVKVIEYPLPILFEFTNVHISIYSTTLYDALRYNLKNFVFKPAGCEDYVNEIIKNKIAEEISSLNFFILNIKSSFKNSNESSFFYQSFKPSVL
ncbi:MAG: hypothetical protein ABI388_10860 [Bacteroidia bacterium]